MEMAREARRPYDGAGLGAGGKFRKKPFRRTTHSTPYDRPPTAIQNPTGGWLSKLVDPAHRLITSSAHRFFSTFFRKRLPPPQPPSTEANSEARIKQQEAVITDNPGERLGAVDQSDAPSKSSNGGGLNELEQILKQKTFTRSEIDRLTALLHSKTTDTSIENGEKSSEVIPLKSVVSHHTQDAFPKMHAQANGIKTHLVSTPAAGSSVLDEDVASPAELAKAYMGSRPSKVSPSTLGFRSQAFRENSAVLSSLAFPSKLPITPLAPRTSGHAEASENGFITPRSRGRTAIYSMARTPYTWVHQTTSLKGIGSAVGAYGGPSSSQSAQEQGLFSSSKQGALKRRSSVLDNDIGSAGPARRIRQKQSLLSSRGLSPPVSGSFSISAAGLGSGAFQKPSSSIQKLNSLGELKNDYRKASTEESTMPSTSFSSVPTKSSEMASKILQQLDKLVSPKDKSSEPKLLTLMDKSPTKLSPSMLHGKALKSLEAVDSSKFLVDAQDNNKLDGSLDKTIPNARESTSPKQDMVKENGPSKIVASCEKSTAMVNGVDSAVPKKRTSMCIETTVSTTPMFVASPPQKKRAFRMSAHEDFLELDDDVYANGGAASHSLTNGRQKVDTFLADGKSHDIEAVRLEKSSAFVDSKPSISAVNKKPDPQTSDGSVCAENNRNFVITGASSPSKAVLHTEVATQSSLTSDVASPPKVSNVVQPIFNLADKVASMKDSNAASPIFAFGSKSIDKVPETFTTFPSTPAVVTESAAAVFGSFRDPKPETSSSFPTVPANATDSVSRVPTPSKVGINDVSDCGVFSSVPETGIPSSLSTPTPTPTPTTSTFSFGNLPNSSILNNGSLASTSASPVDFNSLTSQNLSNSSTFTGVVSGISTPSVTTASTIIASSSSLLTSTPASSFPAVSVFKFGSTASTAFTPVSAKSDLVSSESMAKKDTGFGISGTQFGVTAAATASTGSSISGFGSSATSTTDNQSKGSTFSTGSGSMPNSQALSVGTGIASSAVIPIQFGSTTSSPSSGLAGNSISIGSSILGSTASAKMFGSGTTGLGSSALASDTGLGSSALASDTNPISPTSGTPTGLLGANWQPAKSSVFGSTFSSTSPSPGFSFGSSTASGAMANNSPMAFGASTGPATTTNSAPMVFGASSSSAAATNSAPALFGSSNGASTSSIFSFSSPSVSASPQPLFGNPSPTFSFSSSAPANNDQMNMEDSMAEDTVASVPSAPVFGQQPVLPSPSPFPFQFGSAGPSASTPFQFGSQLNVPAPQNPSPSPFPVSGSMGLLPEGSNFSMGSSGSGVDKSNRKFYKVKSKQRKK